MKFSVKPFNRDIVNNAVVKLNTYILILYMKEKMVNVQGLLDYVKVKVKPRNCFFELTYRLISQNKLLIVA